jgi:hypothetical protein
VLAHVLVGETTVRPGDRIPLSVMRFSTAMTWTVRQFERNMR